MLARVLNAFQEVSGLKIFSESKIAPAGTIMKSFIDTTKMNNLFNTKIENSLHLVQKEFLIRIST